MLKIRMTEAEKAAALRVASGRGTTASEMVRAFLARIVKRDEKKGDAA